MEKDPSPLDTLRQLKEWLDAGTITPQEFETLKRKLLFNEAAAPPAAAEPPPTPPPAPTVISTSGSPVEEPLLPPVVHSPAPTAAAPLPPSAPAAPAEPLSRPIESGRPDVSPAQLAPDSYEAAPLADVVEPAPYAAPAKSPLGTILIVGGIVALLAVIGYLMLGSRPSERLTSTSQTAADTVAVRPDEGPQAEQIELAPVAPPETVRIAPAVPPPAAPAAIDSSTTPATEAPATPPAETSAADNATAQTRAQQVLEAYYADLQTAPFDAAQHFAPTVERFYTQSNVTPAAINDELARTHFPEFTEAETQIEPGSLKVGPVANDGSRVVTFVEKSRAFRQSLQKRQQTTAQVRVRLDKNFKIMYLRQEKLLENTFSE